LIKISLSDLAHFLVTATIEKDRRVYSILLRKVIKQIVSTNNHASFSSRTFLSR
jgi:hypothetical protein